MSGGYRRCSYTEARSRSSLPLKLGPSGIASVQYQVGSGSWTTITASAGLFRAAISTEGVNTVSYLVTNNAGTTSASGSCTVKVDTVKPTAKAKAATLLAGKVGKLNLYIAKSPAGCGKARVAIAFYQGKKLKKRFTTAYLP